MNEFIRTNSSFEWIRQAKIDWQNFKIKFKRKRYT